MKTTSRVGPAPMVKGARRIVRMLGVAATAAVAMAGCGGGGGNGLDLSSLIRGGGTGSGGNGGAGGGQATQLTCDDSIKTGFKPDADTSVLLVKAFKKGDPLVLTEAVTAQTPKAANDLCMVKLNVGPGNPGPADAPSTSPGIGIEIWLPSRANWNKRVHNMGSGGWGGGNEGSTTRVSGAAAPTAGAEGAVSATTDSGHGTVSDGSFAMNPDGTIATSMWRDYSLRSIHEQANKAKALATAYYGSAPDHMYFEGGSMGGRQAFASAQSFPQDYNGILVGYPVINWTMLITGELQPQVVIQRDLGGVAPTLEQQDLVSNAAISACDTVGTQHMGVILNPAQCTYDPTKDATVLCPGVTGNGGVVGASTSSSCVNLAQATAMNKFWYGMTADGSVPDPAVDNGWSKTIQSPQRWYGLNRGASTYGKFVYPAGLAASPTGPFTIASDMVALELQDPTIAEPNFKNATGNGASRWKGLSYTQLSDAFDRGVALQGAFSQVNANNPDLSAFKAAGGKILLHHGFADEAVYAQGSINYYEQVVAKLGGLSTVQDFFRLYLVPGMGHGPFHNGTARADANPPMPTSAQLYSALTGWVEKGAAPESLVVTSVGTDPFFPVRPPVVPKSWPICVYPKKITFVSGDALQATSYTCQ